MPFLRRLLLFEGAAIKAMLLERNGGLWLFGKRKTVICSGKGSKHFQENQKIETGLLCKGFLSYLAPASPVSVALSLLLTKTGRGRKTTTVSSNAIRDNNAAKNEGIPT